MKVVFMGSPDFAVPALEALIASHHEVVAVVSQPDRPSGRKLVLQPPAVKTCALRFSLPVLQPESTRSQQFVEQLAAFSPDVLVVAAYGEILRSNLLSLAPFGAVNLHASLLPRYRGAAPVAWAILQGETETGVTTMQMNEAMDAGPMLLQARCPILASDTAGTLTEKLGRLGAALIPQTVDLLERGEIVATPQNPTLVSYAPKLKKEDGVVDWSKPADWISRQIRAFDPWPSTYTFLGSHQIKFWKGQGSHESAIDPPGTIVKADKRGVFVACGDQSVLEVTELQPDSKPRMSASAFVNGYSVSTGTRFVSSRIS